MENLKYKYNENLKRIDKAFTYFNRVDVPLENKLKQLELFKHLVKEQNELMEKLHLRSGDKEVLEGFKVTATA